MAKKYKNSRKKLFLNKLEDAVSINNTNNDIAKRSKFNFSYFVNSDSAGQDFNEWSFEELTKLLDKLKEYTREPLISWTRKKVGKYAVLEIYGAFPKNSYFQEPKHIPIEARWCRIHLENKPRLIGFILPDEYDGLKQESTGFLFDKNTFYVVFLDKEHKFYKTKKR